MDSTSINRNVGWRILQQYSTYIVKIIVQIILARLLMPEDFGVIAIVLVFVGIAEVIAISGLGTALIQKKDPDEKDFATVLTSSFVLSILIYGLLFFVAPFISLYYENNILTNLLRVYGVAIFIQSYSSIQNAYVAKSFKFKKSFIATFIGTFLSGIISVFAAFNGAGLWSLVIQGISAPIFSVLILHIVVPWKPSIGFDKERFKQLISFSWKVLVSSLTGTLLEDLYNLVIGKFYGEETLGYYKQGNSYPSAILGQTRTAINAVMLPVYSHYQDDKVKLLEQVRKMTHLSVFLIFPMAFGLASVSENFVVVVLTEKWLPCLFFLRLECIFYATLPLSASVNSAMISIGRSDISLKLELGKLIATILCVVFMHGFDIKVLCVMRIIIAVLTVAVSIIISKKYINYGFRELIRDTYKPFLASLMMGACVFGVGLIAIKPLYSFIIQIGLGLLFYFLVSIIFMKDDVVELKNIFIKQKN